jgi:hypothetical protein
MYYDSLGSLAPIILISRRKNMLRRRNYRTNKTRFIDRRIPFEDLPLKTMKVTIHALRWVFLLIFLFITVGIFILFLTGGDNYVQIIIGYSIAGFFTFFMGYFGWLLAQGIIEMITGKDTKNDRNFSYYLRKHRRYRF